MFKLLNIFACLIAMVSFEAIASFDINKSFNIENGLMISSPNGNVIWYGGGDFDPSVNGLNAPIGSSYRRTNGSIYLKIGLSDYAWAIEGLTSNVLTQTADFGKTGNSTSGSFLDRSGGVPSNISGITILLYNGYISSVGCSQELDSAFSVIIYEHTGNTYPTGFTSLYTLVSVGKTSISTGLNITVTQGKQLAIMTNTSSKNVGCTVGMKGLSL